MRRPSGRPRGALEAEVLASLAAADAPRTAAEVLDDLAGELAYTTVMTTLSRLHSKGAVTREPRGRAFAYGLPGGPAAAAAAVTATRMRRLLESGDDRAGVLSRFVDGLSPADVEVLTRLLADLPRRRPDDAQPAS